MKNKKYRRLIFPPWEKETFLIGFEMHLQRVVRGKKTKGRIKKNNLIKNNIEKK
jgi:hypothetical protein